jgi:hypothetical protein
MTFGVRKFLSARGTTAGASTVAAIGAARFSAVGTSEPSNRQQSSRGGKKSAESRKPKVEERHAEVLRLMGKIESDNPGISQEKLAGEIERNLPKNKRLGHSQILKIMRASKKS